MTIYQFITRAIVLLNSSGKNYGKEFVRLKMEFFNRYAKGRVGSSKHGSDFFNVIQTALETGLYEYTGDEYDFNTAKILVDHGVRIRKIQ